MTIQVQTEATQSNAQKPATLEELATLEFEGFKEDLPNIHELRKMMMNHLPTIAMVSHMMKLDHKALEDVVCKGDAEEAFTELAEVLVDMTKFYEGLHELLQSAFCRICVVAGRAH